MKSDYMTVSNRQLEFDPVGTVQYRCVIHTHTLTPQTHTHMHTRTRTHTQSLTSEPKDPAHSLVLING